VANTLTMDLLGTGELKVKRGKATKPASLGGRPAERNGIKSPQREGAIATCWSLFDEYPETTSLHLLDYAEALNLNLGNMKIEFYRWRRFNGLLGN
jgi:hypothetical protein